MPNRVLIAVPYYTSIEPPLMQTLEIATSPAVQTTRMLSAQAYIAYNFNRCWCMALNNQLVCPNCNWHGSTIDRTCYKCGNPADQYVTHFVMIHADVEVIDNFWADTMISELEKTGADVLSIVLPIKSQHGLTSTARRHSKSREVRRFTMREIWNMKEQTFDGHSLNESYDLLVSSGLWVASFQDSWVQRVHFEVRDDIIKKADGSFEAVNLGEDWGFSRTLHALGRKIVASKCVKAHHWGKHGWPNYEIWGKASDPEIMCFDNFEA